MSAKNQSAAFERILPSLKAKLRKQAEPTWLPPITLTGEAFSRKGWLFEPKLDGVRCLGLLSDRRVQLMSRNQKPLNSKYPELVSALASQHVSSFTVDGEIVAFAGDVTSFATLQQRMQIEHPSDELRSRVPVYLYLFDLLMLDGHDTRELPLRERRKLLSQAMDFKDPLRITDQWDTEGEAYFHEACRKGWEGIIAKAADGVYVSSRSNDWLKFKCINQQEFVIGGYTDPKGSRAGFGALLVGYYRAGKFQYAGKVGTGYSVTTLENLHGKLKKLETKSPPFDSDDLPYRGVHWVSPKLVAQIGFGEWTKDGRLRQPRFLGLRSDKEAKEVVREK